MVLSTTNYNDWIQMVKSYAQAYQIWNFVNPQSEAVCTEPTKPRVQDYKETAITISDLDQDEKDLYKEDRSDYRQQMTRYDTKQVALANLRTKIIESLPAAHRSMTYSCETVRDMLKQLETRLKPTNETERIKYLDEYVQLCKGTTAKKVDEWLLQWERLYTDLVRLGMVEFSNSKVTRDFLDSGRAIMPEFVISYRIAAKTGGKDLDFWETIREFRDTYHEVVVRDKHIITEHGVFQAESVSQAETSFQGQKPAVDQDGSSRSKYDHRRSCFCGEQHRWEKCAYIVRNQQPTDWRYNAEIVAKIKKSIIDNRRIRPTISKIATTNWLTSWLENTKQGESTRAEPEQAESATLGMILTTTLLLAPKLEQELIILSAQTE